MRCFDECDSSVREIGDQIQDLDFIPTCDKCDGLMRPHVLWFDEQYNQQYYDFDTVRAFAESEVDAYIVVGTALETALAS